MLLIHAKGLLTQPKQEWESIRQENTSTGDLFRYYVLILAAIAPIAGLIGTTQIGWSFGIGNTVKLTFGSALKITVAYYFAILVAVVCIGKLVQWMSETYGSKVNLNLCMALAAYTATPLFLVGILQIYPVMWLNYVIGLPALAYTVYLLYLGTPIVMDIPSERGFLFASAILAVGLVALVGILAATVVLWGMGIGPTFTA